MSYYEDREAMARRLEEGALAEQGGGPLLIAAIDENEVGLVASLREVRSGIREIPEFFEFREIPMKGFLSPAIVFAEEKIEI